MINSFLRYFRGKEQFYSVYRGQTANIIKSKNEAQVLWEKKMKFYMKTYEDLFGITKLTEMHDKVRDIQNNLQTVQEKRRKMQEEIFLVQKKLQEMQDILRKISMGDDMYISVVTQVHELLKEQKRLQDVFSLYDQSEREQQTTLALAIKNSQDHERTYREKNKYLSLITGITGAVLGLVGSSINNWRHRKDIKHFAADITDEVVYIADEVSDLKKSVEKLKLISSVNEELSNESSEETDNLLSSKNHNNSSRHIEELLSNLERNIEVKLNSQAQANMGFSVSLIGSCTLLMAVFVYFLRNS